jgi:hypothetical protein
MKRIRESMHELGDEQSGPNRIRLRCSLAAVCQALLTRSHFTLVIVLGLVVTAALQGQVDEYQVKAFFLYNFTRYVEWPSQSFNSPNDPIEICILKQNPFGNALEEAISGKVVEGRTLVVRQITDIPPKCKCHILFVNASERARFRSICGTVRGSGILTVGETQEFTNDGGVITFKLEDGKVRFEINVKAAGQEHLYISSNLLSVAQIVKK